MPRRYENRDYRDLQRLARERGVDASLPKPELIKALRDQRAHPFRYHRLGVDRVFCGVDDRFCQFRGEQCQLRVCCTTRC